MTWEVAALLMTIVLCGTALASSWLNLDARIEEKAEAKVKLLGEDLFALKTRLSVVEGQQVTIAKIAEDAKKLVSQGSLSQALTPVSYTRSNKNG